MPHRSRLEAFPYLTLKGEDGEILAYNTCISGEYKDCELCCPKIRSDVTIKGSEWIVKLTSDLPAFFVWLSADGMTGHFSDNCFTLLPECPVEIKYVPSNGESFDDFRRQLSITDLASIYK